MRGVILLGKEHAIFNQLPYLDRAEEIGIGVTFGGGQEGCRCATLFSFFLFSEDKRESVNRRDLLRREIPFSGLQSGLIQVIMYFMEWMGGVRGTRWYHEQALRNLAFDRISPGVLSEIPNSRTFLDKYFLIGVRPRVGTFYPVVLSKFDFDKL